MTPALFQVLHYDGRSAPEMFTFTDSPLLVGNFRVSRHLAISIAPSLQQDEIRLPNIETFPVSIVESKLSSFTPSVISVKEG
jgi:hypothetical protein